MSRFGRRTMKHPKVLTGRAQQWCQYCASDPGSLSVVFDGYPIYFSNGQFNSSWSLTNASKFTGDTWTAH
jgi:hypothetical protein